MNIAVGMLQSNMQSSLMRTSNANYRGIACTNVTWSLTQTVPEDHGKEGVPIGDMAGTSG